MKLKDGYELVHIIEEWVVVPIGGRMLDVNGVLSLSESGAILWNMLKEETNIDDLVSLLLSEYEIDRDTAETDVVGFISDLNRLGLLITNG